MYPLRIVPRPQRSSQRQTDQGECQHMSKYSSGYIAFAKTRMAKQGEEIRQWVKSDNPLLSQTCLEIIEASGAKQ